MKFKIIALLQAFYKIFFAFVITVLLVRIFEYITVASKFFIKDAYRFELNGLLYDIWSCFIYSCTVLIPFAIIFYLNKKVAAIFFHLINVIVIICYLSLITVFSERTHPFDHEFFTRSFSESWTTSKQMMTTGFGVYLPFIIYLAIYFGSYYLLCRKIGFKQPVVIIAVTLSVLSLCFINFSIPGEEDFQQPGGYYLTCNKFSYWINDSYHYFKTRNSFDASKLNNKQLESEIDFYQHNHPFDFTSREYPLLHKNNGKDVLGSFFNLNKEPPNIVILVVEGLSRDFSGDKAYASSFTPFLDSLSGKSLVWDNFLSTAPGTFAAHPAISGSLPYGKRGFSLMNVMPDHLSLIKILRANGYQTNFMIGFNPDFDNMGGYIRLQGTDFILTKYGAQYHEMGMGSEGWSMGYPDDALFSRSFEVMDSINKTPYLNIYHTATTHLPYLFAQQHTYEKLFDEKMKTLSVAPDIKKTLKECKKVLVTYMFSDDCIKKFFADYQKRSDYANTIFFITGDHHIGSFPSTVNIDDYHVPLIVYSPMLKQAKKFYSVNSHNNLAPTITSLLLNNYKLPYNPEKVNWIGDVLDTCATFRNVQSMPFMAWSREINDYIYKDFMLSEGQLYKLTPELLQEPYQNDSLKKHIGRLLDNFKLINSYVCDNNKVFPAKELLTGKKVLLFSFADSVTKKIVTIGSDTSLMPLFPVPDNYTSLYVNVSADILLPGKNTEDQPSFRLGMVDIKKQGRNYIYWTNHDLVQLTDGDYIPLQWNHVSTTDLFTLADYRAYHSMVFDLALYNQQPVRATIRNLKVNIYGVK